MTRTILKQRKSVSELGFIGYNKLNYNSKNSNFRNNKNVDFTSMLKLTSITWALILAINAYQ